MVNTNNMEQQENNAPVMGALINLFNTLQECGIRYCHWKSNIRLEKSLRGETDLDLLVDREHSRDFRRVLNEQNIKLLVAAPSRTYPAMENYLGFDDDTGMLFHLHVHYQLVLGEQFVKNYRLPLEKQFLDTVHGFFGVNVPAPELELIVLSIRILLKYRTRDLIKDVFPYRYPGLSPSFRKEILWLLSQTSREQVARVLESIGDVVPAGILMEFLDIAIAGKRAGLKMQRLRNRLRRTLSLFQRTNTWSAALAYLQGMWEGRKIFRFLPITGMTLPEGGLKLAIIGIDGAGKSTLSGMLRKWLSWKLDVHVCYLGSKPPSRRSRFVYVIFRAFRRGQTLIMKVTRNALLSRWMENLRDTFLAWHHLSIGQDRYTRYIAGEKQVMGGSVVIYDRFPLGAITPEVDSHLMDGPQIESLLGAHRGGLMNLLSRKESEIYHQMKAPDCLVILDIDPETSFQRKSDHKRDVIENKTHVINDFVAMIDSKKVSRVIHIDANAPLDVVFSQLKKEIWHCM